MPNVTRFGFQTKKSGAPDHLRVGGFILDMSQINRRMKELNENVMPSKIINGLKNAGAKFMNDVVVDMPTAPIRRAKPGEAEPYGGKRTPGGLRGSGALFVNAIKRGDTTSYGIPEHQPAAYGGTPIPKNSFEACIVFNAPYTAIQHEKFPVKTEPTAGTGFMGKKLYANGTEYITIVMESMKL